MAQPLKDRLTTKNIRKDKSLSLLPQKHCAHIIGKTAGTPVLFLIWSVFWTQPHHYKSSILVSELGFLGWVESPDW